MFSQVHHSPDTAAVRLAYRVSFVLHGQRKVPTVQRLESCGIDGIQQPSRNRPRVFVSVTSWADLNDARALDQTPVCATGKNGWDSYTPKKGQTR
jgi:hypothetical protein